MNTLNKYTAEYISYCEYRKRLNFKTLKAYRIDLNQYSVFCNSSMDFLSRNTLDLYITELHKHYKPKSVKRKIASLKAFFHYLEYADLLVPNPFDKLDVHFREAKLLPKTIPFHSIQKFLSVLYAQKNQAASTYQLRCCLRDIAVIELLFATGMRISELCSLRPSDIDLENNTVLIYGKGSKERILQLGNPEVISALMLYQDSFKTDISVCGYFFVNKQKHKLSDQSVRFMINRYANLAGIEKEYIRRALSDFKGVEHRLEKVATVRGVEFINDSKATNVNSCWYALQSMKTKTVLILGGKDKGNDYTEIEDLVREKCSALVYLGLHNEKLHDFFDRMGLPVADVQTGMKDAVDAAFRLAKKGETVLLSPCCASFDLFNSYEDRGDQFKEYVRAL